MMTPEAQRIAIAEACGWTNCAPVIVRNVTKQGDDRQCGISSDRGWIPDYLSDLNAMHEAEKAQDFHEVGTEKARAFAWALFLVTWPQDDPQPSYEDYCERGNSLSDYSLSVPISATAAQRAEAFLRTLKPELFN